MSEQLPEEQASDKPPPEGEGMAPAAAPAGAEEQSKRSPWSWVFRIATWVAAAACFWLVYTRIEAAAARQDATAFEYLVDFFAGADWVLWLAVMMPYSVFFFLVDSHATWRVIRWFNASGLRLGHMLPIRASAYILSLVNEQVGKGAMTLYLLKRHNTPGWETLSSMIFLGLMEVYQLLMFSAIGVALNFHLLQEASTLLPLDWIFPIVLAVAAIYLPLHIAWFRAGAGGDEDGGGLRNRPLLRAFRRARPIHYLLVVLYKAPNLLGAVVVYTIALELFQVQASLGQMLAFLPVIFLAAALPLPFHAGALLLWTVLFPDYPEVGAFSLVMHTFFVLFNALIGVLFLPRANKELFG